MEKTEFIYTSIKRHSAAIMGKGVKFFMKLNHCMEQQSQFEHTMKYLKLRSQRDVWTFVLI